MTAIEALAARLAELGYGGLVLPRTGCRCKVYDLAPCGCVRPECVAGHVEERDEEGPWRPGFRVVPGEPCPPRVDPPCDRPAVELLGSGDSTVVLVEGSPYMRVRRRIVSDTEWHTTVRRNERFLCSHIVNGVEHLRMKGGR